MDQSLSRCGSSTVPDRVGIGPGVEEAQGGLPFKAELLRSLQSSDLVVGEYSAFLVETAVQVIHATDHALREIEQVRAGTGLDGGFGSHVQKSVGDFVTALDLCLDRHLGRALTNLKQIEIVSEEGEVPPDLGALAETWLIDPLDATTAYMCGEFSLCGPMIAYLRHGEPVFSVMLTLDGSTLGLAERGRGAGLLKASHTGVAWQTDAGLEEMKSLKEGCLLFNPQSDRSRSHPGFDAILAEIGTGKHTLASECRVPHSMAALGLGRNRRVAVVHDNCGEFPKQMAWDVLPVKLWVEERGGVFWGIDGAPYDIRRPMPIIAATNPEIASQLIELSSGSRSR